jgi:hypothetical protein
MGFHSGDKTGGKIHNGMWIMWKSGESNRFFVQCVRLPIIFSRFAVDCCGKRKDLVIIGPVYYQNVNFL